MGAETGIAWTDSTINVWHGCQKVDTLCKHCYAEVSTPVRVKRAGGLELWGPMAVRSETKDWRMHLRRWNAAAVRRGAASRPTRVFGQSLSDTFEDRVDECVIRADGSATATLDDLRSEFFAAIVAAPALTFQLLTKRPENILRMVPPSWLTSWPVHVWIGTSVGDQESAGLRVQHLLRVPARVRFLSVEPQLGPVDLGPWLTTIGNCDDTMPPDQAISWVIQGGESGPKARPFDVAWARDMRDQCKIAGVAYFLKQLGAQPIVVASTKYQIMPQSLGIGLRDSHGGDESEWPADLRGCRAFPADP